MNKQKNQLTPSQMMEYRGVVFDTWRGQVFLPSQDFWDESFVQWVKRLHCHVYINHFSGALGIVAHNAIPIVFLSQWDGVTMVQRIFCLWEFGTGTLSECGTHHKGLGSSDLRCLSLGLGLALSGKTGSGWIEPIGMQILQLSVTEGGIAFRIFFRGHAWS